MAGFYPVVFPGKKMVQLIASILNLIKFDET